MQRRRTVHERPDERGSDADSELPDISPFHEVEVWCRYTERWVPGFWFDGLEPGGRIRLRRGLDQSVLPGSVPAAAVRRARRTPEIVADLRVPHAVLPGRVVTRRPAGLHWR